MLLSRIVFAETVVGGTVGASLLLRALHLCALLLAHSPSPPNVTLSVQQNGEQYWSYPDLQFSQETEDSLISVSVNIPVDLN